MADGSGPTSSLLTWNVTNWITVVLMAAVGFGLLGIAQAWYKKRQGQQ